MFQAPVSKPFPLYNPHNFPGKQIVMYAFFFFPDAEIKAQMLSNMHYISCSSSSRKPPYSPSRGFLASVGTRVITWYWELHTG